MMRVEGGKHTMEKISYVLAYLYCADCQAEYSATPGDYWNAPDGLAMECCDQPMVLCTKGGRFIGDSIVQSSVTVGDLRRLVADVRGLARERRTRCHD